MGPAHGRGGGDRCAAALRRDTHACVQPCARAQRVERTPAAPDPCACCTRLLLYAPSPSPLQYTWDKQLETWVKSSGMLGGNGKEPTIGSPKQYMRRFRTAMQQYFTAVPASAGAEPPMDPEVVVKVPMKPPVASSD